MELRSSWMGSPLVEEFLVPTADAVAVDVLSIVMMSLLYCSELSAHKPV
jgi:hypothetical protein